MIFAFILLIIFQGISGWNDGGNLIGLVEHAGSRWKIIFALLLVGIVIGPFILGARVADTIGNNIILLQPNDVYILNNALLATLATLVLSWFARVPTSTSLALVGGLIGAAGFRLGLHAIHWHGLWMTILSIVISVTLGFVAGELLYKIERRIRKNNRSQWEQTWRSLSYVLSFLQGLAYGANDAEKAIGLAATLLMIERISPNFHISFVMVISSTSVWVIGAMLGGNRIAQTIGHAFYELKPKHVATIQFTSVLVVIGAALLGGPVSTTQTIDSALLGVGHDLRHHHLNRPKVIKLYAAWALTLPIATVLGIIMSLLIH
jgi:PiT family inorganic phosphate transporter